MGPFHVLPVGCLLALAGAVQLPSANHGSELAQRAHNEAAWSVRLGDKVVWAPPLSLVDVSGLSRDVSNYYVTLGSEAALTEEMKAHRVAGEGRVHILHLPQGPEALEVPRSGDRRAAFSALVQLKAGAELAATAFPAYEPSHGQEHSLSEVSSEESKATLKAAAQLITGSSVNSHLTSLVSIGNDGGVTRSWTNDEASKRAEDFLTTSFAKMGLKTCLHKFESQGRSLANVVAFLPGAGGAGTLVVGAHYDSRPFDAKAPGAEDNGSGVASLLSVANAFAAGKVKPQRDVYFVGFAAEEPGLLGSKAFAASLLGQGTEIPAECRPTGSFLQTRQSRSAAAPVADSKISAIIMDEVGWRSPKFQNLTINFESYDWPGTTALMDNLYAGNAELNQQPLKVIHNNHPFGSDHMSFLDKGIPAVLIINADDEAYPNYHQSTDTIDNVDMDYTSQVSKLVFGGAVRTAGTRP